MNRLYLIVCVLISACVSAPIEMAPEPTVQRYDLADSEGDGVINARDLCAETSAGSSINNDGCGSQSIQKIRKKLLINFAIDSYVVEKKYYGEVSELADFMKEFEQTQVVIEGHTSKRGTQAHNLMLSQKRAEAIKRILVSRYQIEADRVTAKGYGFERLLEQGNDEYSHAQNRRIVAELSSERTIRDMRWHIYSVDQEEQ